MKRRNFGGTSKDEKKQIIKTILDHGGEVVSLVRRNKGEQLADLLKTIFATSKKKLRSVFSNSTLADIIYDIYTVVENVSVVTPNVSRSTTATSTTNSSIWRKAVSDLKNTAEAAKIASVDEVAAASNSKYLKLTPTQFGQSYLQDGKRTSDADCCVCINPDCSHQFVDEPDTNASAHATNEAKRLLHKENVEGFVKAQTLGVSYISTTSGKRITSVPRDKHKYNNLYLQCHCLKFSCITQDKHVPEYPCPIKCLDHNGDRFPCDEDGVCQCPICKCQCNKAWTVSTSGGYYMSCL